jgi:Protein of unknown function (DUF4058)
MPLLDHFHPPLRPPHRWEGFLHAWTTFIAQQLNQDTLPRDYFAVPEITVGPELEIDVATVERTHSSGGETGAVATTVWSPPRPKIAVQVDFAHLEGYEVLVYQDLGGAELRAAIELVSPANKDRDGNRRTFAAKCAGYLRHGIGVVIVDVVTVRSADLHEELFAVLEVKNRRSSWASSTGLYAVAYRAVTVRTKPRIEVWPEVLTLGQALPVMPLWLSLDLCVPVRFEESYLITCRSLRISA